MNFSKLKIGDQAPDVVYVLVEIPQGSSNKYEFDAKFETIKLDRILPSSVYYPGEYGFIPETLADDGDPADVLVISSKPTFSGCLLRAKPIALLKFEDSGIVDFKILAVAYDDLTYKDFESYTDFPPHFIKQIVNFFETYKILENKITKVLGWEGADKAKEYIERTYEKYFLTHQ